jgi:signal transduction histidine kinase
MYLFDWRALKRWGVRESELPKGSLVVGRELTLWERNRETMIAALLVIASLSILAAYLAINQKQLRTTKNALLRLSGQLINAQEKERSRLASELHDDFSQRMALLSLNLETAAEKIDESPAQAREQLHLLVNAASEIGADLHSISHRLHSSTLESLGLVAGIRSLCKEFRTQQGIEVDFQQSEIPRALPKDVALCLFRVVQEGLRNVKKHSNAKRAYVDLEVTGDKLHLSIRDEGCGLDLKKSRDGEGLGIQSMAERCRLLGGHFTIHSELNRGTRIEALVPFRIQKDTFARTDSSKIA